MESMNETSNLAGLRDVACSSPAPATVQRLASGFMVMMDTVNGLPGIGSPSTKMVRMYVPLIHALYST